ncbi:MAG: NusG domain II-containing protein [Ruminococcaceae bacterium]|nr:NusG domain II-containing protein [Oscillospiraceae bacterium]
MPAVQADGRRKIKNDIIFIAVLLVAVSLIGLCVFLIRGEGDSVTVTVDGKAYGTYRLSDDVRVEIRTGDGGEHVNVLVIKDGKAYIESADCPDGICASHRAIHREGESIVCLPHKVVVTVISSDKNAPDVVV